MKTALAAAAAAAAAAAEIQAAEEGEGKEENNTKSIETIVNDTIKKLKVKELDKFLREYNIKQSIINVIQYKLDNAKENDLEAKKYVGGHRVYKAWRNFNKCSIR